MSKAERTAQKQLDAWVHPIGTLVEVAIDGVKVRAGTRTVAWARADGLPVICVYGAEGVVPLSKVRAVTSEEVRRGG
jgi:hypothetical protein